MSKKHIFLRVFSKITIFACVFCTLSAWSDTTTCDINYTPVTGNSWQNGTPNPTSPVEIESVGTKVGNKYAVQVAVNYDGGVVDLGTLSWIYQTDGTYPVFRVTISAPQIRAGNAPIYTKAFNVYPTVVTATYMKTNMLENTIAYQASSPTNQLIVQSSKYTTAQEFKQAMSGVMLYYQRATDETWTAPTLRTIYLDEPLRKVGDYADVLDYKKGQIIRNIGVKVLTGTENWTLQQGGGSSYFYASISDMKSMSYGPGFCSHFTVRAGAGDFTRDIQLGSSGKLTYWFEKTSKPTGVTDVASWKSFLATQYANGTPVTIYYPLATPVVEQIENWSCIPPITDIQIATTKFVDEEFKAAEDQLAATVQTIESVVSRTIAQTGQIATLHETKQTRPDENCPANMKCLLVQDEDGTPHWYPIIEP